MDLSIFLILISATFQFIAEYFSWNMTKVRLAIFLFILIITLPNIIFMVIDWWQSPHSKISLLVLNTFQPILRGETYRLFRWLKNIGINLACDDLNHLPISRLSSEAFEFYMTRECFGQTREGNAQIEWTRGIIEEEITYWKSNVLGNTKGTLFWAYYTKSDGVFIVHQLKNSRKLKDIYLRSRGKAFTSHSLFKSSLMRSASYTVDSSRAQLLFTRLMEICYTEMPILAKFENKRELLYFHAVSTLDNLNGDFVLVQTQGECIAVGSPGYTVMNRLRAMLTRRWNASRCEAAEQGGAVIH